MCVCVCVYAWVTFTRNQTADSKSLQQQVTGHLGRLNELRFCESQIREANKTKVSHWARRSNLTDKTWHWKVQVNNRLIANLFKSIPPNSLINSAMAPFNYRHFLFRCKLGTHHSHVIVSSGHCPLQCVYKGRIGLLMSLHTDWFCCAKRRMLVAKASLSQAH